MGRMKQEEKELLIKDLSARTPYGVKIHSNGVEYTLSSVYKDMVYAERHKGQMLLFVTYIDDIKPYLRPMSSMTDEEKEYYYLVISRSMYASNACELVDWFNEHHFDYRGLIEKGLTLEAPEGMYEL